MKKIKNRIITLAVAGLGMACGTGIVAAANEVIKTAYVEDGWVYTDAEKTEKVDEFYTGDDGTLYIDEDMTVEVPHRTDLLVNENGETYGIDGMGIYSEDRPDLIFATGDHGKKGYIRKTELDGEQPSTPEEAVKMMEEREAQGNPNRIINVYESDGVTVIDTFTIGSRTIKNNN